MCKKVFKFSASFGRMGDLEGVFISTQEDVDALFGQKIYFGEVLGKHSEVILKIEPKHITVVTDDAKVISLFDEFDLSNGYNPFDYIEEDEEEEDDE